jgi:hypothetical protein
MKGFCMNKIKTKTVGRITAAAALSIGLAASAVSVAGASDHGSRLSGHHDSFGQSHWNNFLGGVASDVTATSVTVTAHDGTATTYTITGTTVYAEGMTTVQPSALVNGSFVGIQVIATGSTTAGVIEIVPPRPIWESGVVSTVSSTSVTITDHKGTPSTFAITDTTAFLQGKTTVLPALLVMGSHVSIQVSASALMTALSIEIAPPRPILVGGLVTAASLTSVTVTDYKGTSSTFSISGTATYAEGKTTVLPAALVVGEDALIKALPSAPTTAISIGISLPRVFGKVTSVSGLTITVEGLKGVSDAIVTSGTTTITKDGATSGLSFISAGEFVSAAGLIVIGATPTTLDASSVSIFDHWGQPVHVPFGHQRSNSGGSGSKGGSNVQGQSGHNSFQHGNFRR